MPEGKGTPDLNMKITQKAAYAIMIAAAAGIILIGVLQLTGATSLDEKTVSNISSFLMIAAAAVFLTYRSQQTRDARAAQAEAEAKRSAAEKPDATLSCDEPGRIGPGALQGADDASSGDLQEDTRDGSADAPAAGGGLSASADGAGASNGGSADGSEDGRA